MEDNWRTFCNDNNIGKQIISGYFETRIVLTEDDLMFLAKKKLLHDARKGGLVLGESHSKGGVPIIKNNNGIYIIIAEMEGFEYITPTRTNERKMFFDKINKSKNIDSKNQLTNFKIPYKCKILNPKNNKIAFILLDQEEYIIINKISSIIHINEIVKYDNF